jgi:hypothetical protein
MMSLLVQLFSYEESTNVLQVPSISVSSTPVSWNRSSRKEISIDVTDVVNMGKRPHLVTSKERSPLSTLLNVVSVKGDLYLLAVDAVQAEIVAPRSVLGAIDHYVVRLTSTKNIRAVCHLHST